MRNFKSSVLPKIFVKTYQKQLVFFVQYAILSDGLILAEFLAAHRAELIDGQIYYMAPPRYVHQLIKTYVEPDIYVICDKSRLNELGCNGAPDWIIEIASPGSKKMDYFTKLLKYSTAGVMEFLWARAKLQTLSNLLFLQSLPLSNPDMWSENIP